MKFYCLFAFLNILKILELKVDEIVYRLR